MFKCTKLSHGTSYLPHKLCTIAYCVVLKCRCICQLQCTELCGFQTIYKHKGDELHNSTCIFMQAGAEYFTQRLTLLLRPLINFSSQQMSRFVCAVSEVLHYASMTLVEFIVQTLNQSIFQLSHSVYVFSTNTLLLWENM